MIRTQEIIKEYYEKYVLPNDPKRMPYDFLCANEVQEITKEIRFKIFNAIKQIENFCETIAKALKEN